MSHFALKVSQSAFDWLKENLQDKSLLTLLEAVPDENWVNGCFECSTQELAELVGVSDSRIRQLASKLKTAGLAKKFGNLWRFKTEAVRFIHDMPDGRGRPNAKPREEKSC
jgi:hypothetical protein